MAFANNLNVLIAHNDEATRAAMAALLELLGYRVFQAIDGGSGMKVVDEQHIDIAIIGYYMTPRTGFDFASHVLIKGYKLGIIMVTDDVTSDLLVEAGHLGIKQVMRTPVDPDRLSETVRRVLRATGKNPDAIASVADPAHTPDALMDRAIALAAQNARSRMGGPFGAVVASAEGRILGEGVNGVQARCDPTAHAEVIAIRRATEKMNRTRLEGCVLYCSAEPTMLGQALAIGVGIEKICYGLRQDEIGALRAQESGILAEIAKPIHERAIPHLQIGHDRASSMYNAWKQEQDGAGS